jgi:hypothetical protein
MLYMRFFSLVLLSVCMFYEYTVGYAMDTHKRDNIGNIASILFSDTLKNKMDDLSSSDTLKHPQRKIDFLKLLLNKSTVIEDTITKLEQMISFTHLQIDTIPTSLQLRVAQLEKTAQHQVDSVVEVTHDRFDEAKKRQTRKRVRFKVK